MVTYATWSTCVTCVHLEHRWWWCTLSEINATCTWGAVLRITSRTASNNLSNTSKSPQLYRELLKKNKLTELFHSYPLLHTHTVLFLFLCNAEGWPQLRNTCSDYLSQIVKVSYLLQLKLRMETKNFVSHFLQCNCASKESLPSQIWRWIITVSHNSVCISYMYVIMWGSCISIGLDYFKSILKFVVAQKKCVAIIRLVVTFEHGTDVHLWQLGKPSSSIFGFLHPSAFFGGKFCCNQLLQSTVRRRTLFSFFY